MQPKRLFKRSEPTSDHLQALFAAFWGPFAAFLAQLQLYGGESRTFPAFTRYGAIFAAHRAFRGMPCPFSLQLGKIPDRSSFCSSYGKILPVSCSLHALYENSPIPTRHGLTPRRLRRNPIGLDFIRGKIHVMLFSSAPTSP